MSKEDWFVRSHLHQACFLFVFSLRCSLCVILFFFLIFVSDLFLEGGCEHILDFFFSLVFYFLGNFYYFVVLISFCIVYFFLFCSRLFYCQAFSFPYYFYFLIALLCFALRRMNNLSWGMRVTPPCAILFFFFFLKLKIKFGMVY